MPRRTDESGLIQDRYEKFKATWRNHWNQSKVRLGGGRASPLPSQTCPMCLKFVTLNYYAHFLLRTGAILATFSCEAFLSGHCLANSRHATQAMKNWLCIASTIVCPSLSPSPLLCFECCPWFAHSLSLGLLCSFLSPILFVILADVFLITILILLCPSPHFCV